MKDMFENNGKVKSILIVLMGLLFYLPSGFAQITESQAREMLAERGIPEDTLKARLIAKGYNPDNLTKEQLPAFQNVILETIEEIEKEKQVNPKEIPSETPAIILEVPTQPLIVVEAPLVPIEPEPTPTYGQEIFRNNSIAVYQKAEDIVASDAYVLGTGDKIGVIGFGRSQFEGILEIDQEGFIRMGNGLPKVLLKGVTFGNAKELLYQRYSQYHVITRGEFQVTLNKPRNMTVNVFGEAKTTGSFTLPGINTAFNVLSAAGGPTDIGSVRRIKLIRGNETLPLDIYEFMNDPGVAKNYFLQNNDYIHVPIAQKVVEIRGAVTRPMKYELLDNENLTQLIKFAGGAKANAYLADVQVTRFMNDKQMVTNINLRELEGNDGDYILFNGDIVEIKSVDEVAQNVVSISGAVRFPGKYERREGMRISDLISQSVLKPDARLDFGYLLRYQLDGSYKYERVNIQVILDNPNSPANLSLGLQDMVQVMSMTSYAQLGFFSVIGAVNTPDTFSFNPDGRLKLEEAILLAGGTKQNVSDFGYIMRLNPREPKAIEYIHFDLMEAMKDPSSSANIEIKDGDQIMIFNKNDRRDDFTVAIYGSVRTPGIFPYGQGMSLADIVSLAGGFKYEADNERIDLARTEYTNGQEMKITLYNTELARDFETNGLVDNSLKLQPFDHIYIRTIPEFEGQQTVRVDGEFKYPGTYPILEDKERIADLVARAGGLTGEAFPEGAKLYRLGDSTGLVVINLAEILQNGNVPSNIVLRSGDVLIVPKSRDLVTIGGYVNLGDVYSQGILKGRNSVTVAFRGEKSAKHYIDKFAAGVSKDGSLNEIRVQFADGRAERTKKFLFVNQYPTIEKGATITVGPKEVKPTVAKAEKNSDWGNILRDTVYQATAILTLIILIDQLSN